MRNGEWYALNNFEARYECGGFIERERVGLNFHSLLFFPFSFSFYFMCNGNEMELTLQLYIYIYIYIYINIIIFKYLITFITPVKEDRLKLWNDPLFNNKALERSSTSTSNCEHKKKEEEMGEYRNTSEVILLVSSYRIFNLVSYHEFCSRALKGPV